MKKNRKSDDKKNKGSDKGAAARQALGRAGEDLAAEYLEGEGYQVVERNFRCRSGELDLIARQGAEWVFVEVKTRSRGGGFGLPCEAVNRVKKRHMSKAILYYGLQKGICGREMRVDVIEVLTGEDGAEIRHIKNAF